MAEYLTFNTGAPPDLNGPNLNLLQARIQADIIPTVARYGAVGDGSTDDTTAVKAMIATGARSIVLQPGKRYLLTDELVLGQDQSIYGFGARLEWQSDLGTGKYGVRWTATGLHNWILDASLLGPGWFGGGLNPSQDPGVSPANMRGCLLPAGGRVKDVYASGFNSGLEFRENNEWFINVVTGGNLVGIRRAVGATAGDQKFVNVKGDRDYLAFVHIDVDATIGGGTWDTGFAGNVPYGFYAPGGGASAPALLAMEFIDFGFEGYGNGAIYAGGNRIVSGLTFRKCSEGSGFAGPSITGNSKNAVIEAYGVDFVSDNGFPAAVGSDGIIKGTGSVTGTWTELENPLSTAIGANKPMVWTGDTADALYGARRINRVIEFCRSISGQTVQANEVVETYSNGVRRASTGIARGVALHNNYTNGPIPVVQSGIVSVKTSDTGFNGVHRYARVDDANPGTVVSTTDQTAANIIGTNVAGLSSGLVPIKLQGLA